MGSLFSSWQQDKCCIVRFLSLDGLGRFVFWTRCRMPALSSVGLSPQSRAHPQGKLLGGGASPPTPPPTPPPPWQQYWMMSLPFKDWVPCLFLLKQGILYISWNIISVCKAGINTRWEIYCWPLLSECSWRHWVLIWIGNMHCYDGGFKWQLQVADGEMGFLFLICFPRCQVQLVPWLEFCELCCQAFYFHTAAGAGEPSCTTWHPYVLWTAMHSWAFFDPTGLFLSWLCTWRKNTHFYGSGCRDVTWHVVFGMVLIGRWTQTYQRNILICFLADRCKRRLIHQMM